ncbi:hypothetical protein EV699_10138 [Plasticicumulans lactativorans]|uniref:Uncharacterized protein n=1 Tax=Plasticicumulans lactativorans TaxID=1133106 RepID=A0A4R2LFQ4_9GAMM|nr:hypothetical protein [Plasticicumulans lactativorans]TCO83654.1 hypothetical protein EV699_10138 [Plasticicumulans lactativorans]
MILVVLLLVIALGAWWWLSSHHDAALVQLQEAGFQADVRFDDAVNPVLLDTRARRIAVLAVPTPRVYDYAQLSAWALKAWERPGGSDRSEPRVDHELILRLNDPEHPHVRLTGFDAATARRWLEQLERELPQARQAP